jgi:hypothetical protein
MKMIYVSLSVILLCSSCKIINRYNFINNEITNNNYTISSYKLDNTFNLVTEFYFENDSSIENFDYINGWMQIGNKKILLKKEGMLILIHEGKDNNYVFWERSGKNKINSFNKYNTVNNYRFEFIGLLNNNELNEIENEIKNNRNNVSIYYEYIINNENYIIDIYNGFTLEIEKNKYRFSDFIRDFAR